MVDNEITYLTVKQIITLVLSGLFTAFIIPLLKEVYQKLRNGKNSDVLGDAITIFLSPFVIYVVLAAINIELLLLIDKHNENSIMDVLIFISIIISAILTLCIPAFYARNYILIKNKFYLFRKNKQKFELLTDGVDLISEKNLKIERNIPDLEKLNRSTSGEYKIRHQSYYNTEVGSYFTEAIYTNVRPVKRFFNIIPKRFLIICFTSYLVYILQLLVMNFIGVSNSQLWILVIWITIMYLVNFAIPIRIMGIIEKDNEKERYIGFYKENNLL
ncbi:MULTISPECIES: hypothetical protein [Staphylococcus]|uniref:Uncharacterized protein n=1 Tax=Staphylococcus xylosus TaxID=1288 RepID=A0A418IMZ3_STAXY|nr:MULTISPECIES: hypothetical protein [Staphylococcus]MDW8544538.1 hypothetical protein [Staphylococcus sp. KG4-1]MDW8544640.1 hypothetical protein [Staphylococcus pseudoxylosus]MDW8563208.1 hypothetical protein [Staphylococcus sp. KG4-3]MDW8571628.1 hypothetical protein [Staphylococcus shinii]MDW8574363.1 hypothetical protein [Staphylococcus shinii]